MHTSDIILVQITATIAAVIITYNAFMQPYPIPPKAQLPQRGLNTAKLIYCNNTPSIHIHIFATSAHNIRRLVRTLNAADYSTVKASITILGDASLVQKLDVWQHGEYQFATRSLSQLKEKVTRADEGNETLTVIILDDYMDPSPLYALWFLIQRCAYPGATAIAGGGDKANVAGLAMSAETWNGFVYHQTSNRTITTASVISYLSSLSSSVIIFPSLKTKDHVFVRSEWQNTAYVEKPPRLMRSWDPEHEPIWGALEVRL